MRYQAISTVIFMMAQTEFIGLEPLVGSPTGEFWYRVTCRKSSGEDENLNIRAHNNDEALLLQKLGCVMFGLSDASEPYLVCPWSGFGEMLVPIINLEDETDGGDGAGSSFGQKGEPIG